MMDWLKIAKEEGCVDIGQIPADQLKLIHAAVRRGELIKFQELWAGMRMKNHYAAPKLLPEFLLTMQKQKTL